MEDFCKLTFVYWIHLPTHTNYYTEGYIGVTTNPHRRWNDHQRATISNRHPNSHLSHAIEKYDNLEFTIIKVGQNEDCYTFEQQLRPQPSIGWNLMSGGKIGKMTEEGRKRLAEKRKYKKMTEEEKLTAAWKRYRKKVEPISKIAYIDKVHEEKGLLPPSKKGIPVFSLKENEEYPCISIAAEVTYSDPLYILYQCQSKTSENWIFLKDL